MKKAICFYFQVHQPFRLRGDYDFFKIGSDHYYEDLESNKAIIRRIARDCYLPMNQLMLKLIQKYKGEFKVSYSISGLALEQFEQYVPEVLDSFRALVQTGCVELIGETYYHSLAFLRSQEEFLSQIELHRTKLMYLFGVVPTTFRNTELIYNNQLAALVEQLGYQVILAEGAEQLLRWRSPNFVYRPAGCQNLRMLVKNYKLSDDIAFRFSHKGWADYPLTPKKYLGWLENAFLRSDGDVINLFMDYETFGEHQKKGTGIFKFTESLIKKAVKKYKFLTTTEVARSCSVRDELDCPDFISWADEKRDISAWVGNSLQDSALEMAYSLEMPVKQTKDQSLIHTWRKLLASDHNYYTCTKWHNDGDVHTYFSPFKSPHDAYVTYTNILNDLKLTIEDRLNI